MNKFMVNRVDMNSIGGVQRGPKRGVPKTDFGELLHEASSGIKFSKHAEARLKSRNINLDGAQLQRIENGIEKAEKKGVKETLLLMDNLAFIASTKNKTIITTATVDSLDDNIFTNIDGAVIV